MTRQRFLAGAGVLLLLVFWTIEAPAKAAASNRSTASARSKALAAVSTTSDLRVRSLKAKDVTKKAASVATLRAKGCACALAQEAGGGGCFSSCLERWGVSPTSILTCGGVCALAGTGNPVAIIFCAACLGIHEWIVLGCAGKCTLERAYEVGMVKNRKPRPIRELRVPDTNQTPTNLADASRR